MNLSDKGLAVLQHFEGCELTAYRCSAKVWTIGYGHTKSAKRGMKIAQADAVELLKSDLDNFESAVMRSINGAPTTQNQFDAMVCLAFNIGASAFHRSTVCRRHRNQEGEASTAAAFHMWKKAGGRVLAGLVRRRKSEAHLYLHDEVRFFS